MRTKNYTPKLYDISKIIRYKVKRCDILEICYSNGERICHASVIIPEASSKLDRRKGINFLRKKWDRKLGLILSGQIFHYEGFYHKSVKTGKIETSKGTKKSYGATFSRYDSRYLPINLMY